MFIAGKKMKISSSAGKQSQDRYICILLVLVLVGSAFQNVKVIGPLNPGHLFALCFIPFLLPKFREAKFPPAVICIFWHTSSVYRCLQVSNGD